MSERETPIQGTEDLAEQRRRRACIIAEAGGIEQALAQGTLPRRIDTTVAEALVLGLLRQGVRVFVGVFGHGSTEVGEVLRLYEEAGLVRTYAVRHETEAAHAAMALRWVTGEKAAVFTSIGPGALHALAGSLAAASDGIGVWHLYGDETTEDEGPNMQQIPKAEQNLYLQLCSTMGRAYTLHTPLALGAALRYGQNTVDHPHRAGPFFLLLPMNIQPGALPGFNLDELPVAAPPRLGAAADEGAYAQAAEALLAAERVVVRVGGGAREAGPELLEFLELADGVAVVSPIVSGIIPYQHPRNMVVGGSKGSLCGNYAMDEADLLVAIGTRFVCQSDSSRTAYPGVRQVININTDTEAAMHYGHTISFIGDAGPTLARLNEALRQRQQSLGERGRQPSAWLARCTRERQAWEAFKAERYRHPTLYDPMWRGEVLTQVAAIKVATDWARAEDMVTFFDAGDVQANGFQIVEDERPGRTFTETGASYMGFAVSALLASALATRPFYALAISGDGSFTMNPQILIDGVEHGAHGCILLLDNRRMAAISGLQVAQYGQDYATSDGVAVDYLAWARAIPGVHAMDGGRSPEALATALAQARSHPGLSLVHVPVYYGPDPLGGLGAFGRWNVGNWVEDTQALRHQIGL
jgi:3D-(3,5/4)-trihydroxycyclohexane-1,2-dione acylhydrolase (decyclizing)